MQCSMDKLLKHFNYVLFSLVLSGEKYIFVTKFKVFYHKNLNLHLYQRDEVCHNVFWKHLVRLAELTLRAF